MPFVQHLKQFQILPLSAEVYPSSAGISSLEMSNLFPQVGGSSNLYISQVVLALEHLLLA